MHKHLQPKAFNTLPGHSLYVLAGLLLLLPLSFYRRTHPKAETAFVYTPVSASDTLPYHGDAAKIGVNGFHWIPLKNYQPFAAVREYLHWDWMEAVQGSNRFDPSDGANGHFDRHFAALKSRGKSVVACINETPAWLSAAYPQEGNVREYKPVPFGESPLLPESYRHLARFLFQLSARYGRVKHDASALSVNTASRWTNDPRNSPRSGLDLLQYIEVWNEPDKNWSGRLARFEPEEYAAMLSACYDGHEGRLGPGFGIKSADSSMQVVMGGLSNFDLPYVSRMLDWFSHNRKDGLFAADVVNYHHYCNKTSWLNGSLTAAVSPEADRIREKLREVVAFNRKHTPHCAVWYSEFGYDTHPGSPQHSQAYGAYNAVEVQAMWLERTYLEAIAAGINKCFVYNISDEKKPENGLFQSSGLTLGEYSGFTPKHSWNRLLELSRKLNSYCFVEDLSQDESHRLYVFQHEQNGDKQLVGWLTSTGKSAQKIQGNGYRLTLTEAVQFYSWK